MAVTSPAGFPDPDNNDVVNNAAGAFSAALDAREPFLGLVFANAAARDAVITATTGHVGQEVYLNSPGRKFRIASISGSTVTWAESGAVPFRTTASYTVPNTLTGSAEIGVGVPASFPGYGRGTNGPTVPIDGDYAVTVVADCRVAGVAVGSASYRSFLAVQCNGSVIGRANFGVGENLINVSALTPLITAGTEISATIYQASGSTATATVTWTVSRNSIPA